MSESFNGSAVSAYEAKRGALEGMKAEIRARLGGADGENGANMVDMIDASNLRTAVLVDENAILTLFNEELKEKLAELTAKHIALQEKYVGLLEARRTLG